MKKKLLAVGVAATLGVMSGVAGAAMEVQASGVGHVNVLPYYSVQGGNATLISITNTDQVNGKVVKVRFRGVEFSDDVFDFQVFMSPGDVFTGAVTQEGTKAKFATVDKTCTLPASVNQPFVDIRLRDDKKPTGTLEGYVEIINMGDIPFTPGAGTPPVPVNALGTAIQHVRGVAPCTAAALIGPNPNVPWSHATGPLPEFSSYLVPPTTGIMSHAIIINVPTSKAFTVPATAISPTAAVGYVPYWRQANIPLAPGTILDQTPANLADLTHDRIFFSTSGAVKLYEFDLPDLSTPYDPAAAGSALAQRDLTSAALQRPAVYVDYVTDTSILAATDVVLSQPTRRYYYTYTPITESVATVTGADGLYASLDVASNRIGVGNATFYDREEQTSFSASSIVISPNPPSAATRFSLLGEVAIISVNSSKVPTDALGGSITSQIYTAPNGFRDGWAFLSTTTAVGGLQLPVIGFEAINVFNGGVGAAGTNYGLTLPLRGPVAVTPSN